MKHCMTFFSILRFNFNIWAVVRSAICTIPNIQSDFRDFVRSCEQKIKLKIDDISEICVLFSHESNCTIKNVCLFGSTTLFIPHPSSSSFIPHLSVIRHLSTVNFQLSTVILHPSSFILRLLSFSAC